MPISTVPEGILDFRANRLSGDPDTGTGTENWPIPWHQPARGTRLPSLVAATIAWGASLGCIAGKQRLICTVCGFTSSLDVKTPTTRTCGGPIILLALGGGMKFFIPTWLEPLADGSPYHFAEVV